MEFDSPDRSSSRDNRSYSAVIFEYLAIISTTFLPLGFYFWSFRFIVLLECTPPASVPPTWSLPRTWTPIRRTASGPAPAACRIADTASSYTIPPCCWRSACLWQTPRRARPSTRQDIGIWQTGRWIFSLPSAQCPPHFSALCTKKMCGTHTAAIAV